MQKGLDFIGIGWEQQAKMPLKAKVSKWLPEVKQGVQTMELATNP